MTSKKNPWWRPLELDVYVGVVLFHGESVLLRRLDSKGYRWTFPRRKIREVHVDIEYSNACALAETMGAQLSRVIAIPGTWRGEASIAHYWRAEASSFTPPALSASIAEAESAFGEVSDDLVDIAARFTAAGLPLSQCGKPLPLSPELKAFFIDMADSLPPADTELSAGDNLEWMPVAEVAHHVAQSESKRGRRRDMVVWHSALVAGRITKPLEITSLGWTRQTVLTKGPDLMRVSAERENDLHAWPFPVQPAPIEYNMRAIEALRGATKYGWRLQACFTCRHLKCSGMATEAGGGWCTAARTPDDERRAEIPYSMGWCPTYEAALVSRGGIEVRRDDPKSPKEQT